MNLVMMLLCRSDAHDSSCAAGFPTIRNDTRLLQKWAHWVFKEKALCWLLLVCRFLNRHPEVNVRKVENLSVSQQLARISLRFIPDLTVTRSCFLIQAFSSCQLQPNCHG